ncbi:MAG: hypothetical protein IJ662_09315, partial [Clostridia bacterium]|nr:hypothetical protein [Clostridia bacterium]
QAAAPVRTGALRQSIAARAADQGAVAAAAAPYAAIVEMGGFHRPAQPYLLPAFQASDYTARAARALREVLR